MNRAGSVILKHPLPDGRGSVGARMDRLTIGPQVANLPHRNNVHYYCRFISDSGLAGGSAQ